MWDEQKTDQCVKDWNDGFSAGNIAQRLGGSVTRNAVIGKIHRLAKAAETRNLITRLPSTRAEAARQEFIRKRKRKQRSDGACFAPVFAKTPLPPEPPKPAKLVSFEDLTDATCRFVYGDPKGKEPWGYCTCEKLAGSSYCPGHHGAVFTAPAVVEKPTPRKVRNVVRFDQPGRHRLTEVAF